MAHHICMGFEGIIVNEKVSVTKCTTECTLVEKCCNKHSYLKDSSNDFLNSLSEWEKNIDDNNNVSYCKCGRFTPYYRNLIKNTCTICRALSKVKCKWIDRYGNPCRFDQTSTLEYCTTHSYVTQYTDEQKKSARSCSGCHMIRYIDPSYKTCSNCLVVSTKNNTNLKQLHKENHIPCGILNCKHKAKQENKNQYCHLHSKYVWYDEAIKDVTKKVCSEFTRGCDCRNLLDINSNYKKCDDCRLKDRTNENKYLVYKKSAKTNNREFELTKEEVDTLVFMNCHYCDVKSKTKIGIDRKDNNIGYTVENSLPACYTCNFMKQKLSYDAFIQCCKNINNASHDVELGTLPDHAYIKEKLTRSTESCTRKNAKNDHNKDYVKRYCKLTYDDCKEILSNKCTYCKNTNNCHIGLDRVNSYGDYTLENTVSCCTICNFMKFQFTVDLFYEKAKLISKHFKDFKKVTLDINKVFNNFDFNIDVDLKDRITTNTSMKDNDVYTQVTPCQYTDCTQLSSIHTNNTYCVEHFVVWYNNSVVVKNTTKKCVGRNRRCGKSLDIAYPYNNCIECRQNMLHPIDLYKYYSKQLTSIQVDNLLEKPCIMCGLIYNDKLEIDYVTLQPCCQTCNRLRNELSISDFIQCSINIKENYKTLQKNSMITIEKVYETISKIKQEITDKIRKNNHNLTITDYTRRLSRVCYFCKNLNNVNETVDLFRLDLEEEDETEETEEYKEKNKKNKDKKIKEYNTSNTVPCCTTCSEIANLSSSVDNLIKHVTHIYNTHINKRCYFSKIYGCESILEKEDECVACEKCMIEFNNNYNARIQIDLVNQDFRDNNNDVKEAIKEEKEQEDLIQERHRLNIFKIRQRQNRTHEQSQEYHRVREERYQEFIKEKQEQKYVQYVRRGHNAYASQYDRVNHSCR